MSELEYIIEQIKDRAPGPGSQWFTVNMQTLARIKWNPLVDPPIEKLIGDEVGGLVRFDEHGNPQFQLTAESCRARTRREIKNILQFELRARPIAPILEDFTNEVLGRIMGVIEKEGNK